MAEAKAAFAYYNQTGFVALRSQALTVLALGQERTGDLTGAQANYEALLETAVDGGNQRRSPSSTTSSAACWFSANTTSLPCGTLTRA